MLVYQRVAHYNKIKTRLVQSLSVGDSSSISCRSISVAAKWWSCHHTVDGCEILHQFSLIAGFFPLFIGFQPSKVMQDFFHLGVKPTSHRLTDSQTTFSLLSCTSTYQPAMKTSWFRQKSSILASIISWKKHVFPLKQTNIVMEI